MDAYDIALLMANQDSGRPLKMRYGTVADNAGSLLHIVPDGQTETTPAVKCCHPLKGDRVILLVNGTEWLAVSVIGGGSPPPRVGQPFVTAADEDPHELWPETTWRKLEDKFILGSGSRKKGETGGEESHRLTVAEMPEHNHYLKQHNNDGSETAWIGAVEQRLYRWSSENTMSAGGSQPHNNMPPYEVFDIWIRTA